MIGGKLAWLHCVWLRCAWWLHRALLPRRSMATKQSTYQKAAAAALYQHSRRGNPVLGRPGNDLLFQVLRLSTIGAGEFNGRVRDGIGFRLPAKTTKPAKDRYPGQQSVIKERPP